MKKNKCIVYSKDEDLYWNNEHGWGDLSLAAEYLKSEISFIYLPMPDAKIIPKIPVSISFMIDALAESEWEGLSDRDLRAVLRDGIIGWNNMEPTDIIDQYMDIWGDDHE